ncbi:MAG: ATP-binding protein [Flavobacteriales bacterium]|nr:ATP-binding protein [Flavobacteriales bacterium]
MNRIKTNWHVITGGPCTGKTTIVNELAEQGFQTTIEHARHYIDTQKEKGNSVEEIRANKLKFQLGVLEMQIEQEAKLNTKDLVFLDRALPDGLAYYHFLDLELDEKAKKAMNKYCYKSIFILDRLPLINDYARREDAEDQKRIHSLISKVYETLPCPVNYVPVLPPDERTSYILSRI